MEPVTQEESPQDSNFTRSGLVTAPLINFHQIKQRNSNFTIDVATP